jgi:hypothetical protein
MINVGSIGDEEFVDMPRVWDVAICMDWSLAHCGSIIY